MLPLCRERRRGQRPRGHRSPHHLIQGRTTAALMTIFHSDADVAASVLALWRRLTIRLFILAICVTNNPRVILVSRLIGKNAMVVMPAAGAHPNR